MTRTCPLIMAYLDRGASDLSPAELKEIQDHLHHCAHCRDQWAAEKALEDHFAEVSPPRLSPRFVGDLFRRIEEEPLRQERRRAGLHLLMQAYWVAAALVAAVLLLHCQHTGGEIGLPTALLLLVFAVPTLLLGRVFRIDLLDLLLTTMQKNW